MTMYAKKPDTREPTMICEECGEPSHIRVITTDGKNVCERCADKVRPWKILDYER